MELRQGFPLLIQQYRALFMKNLLLSWRHVAATIMQLFSSLIFIFLIFCIQKATQSQSTKGFPDPEPLVNPPIPPCEDKFFVKTPCFDFVWSGNKSPRASMIVENIMNNNPGRKIPVEKVKSFNTKQEVDEWLFNNPKQCPAALHINDRTSSSISYGLQTNSTAVSRRGRFEDPVFKFQVPLQFAAEREIARTLLGEPKFSWDVTLRGYALPSGPDFSTLATIGPTFFLAICMFGFVFQISSLIAEKELKLRQAMTMMGLFDTAYWFSWLTWEVIIGSLSALFTVLFGMMFQLEFFIHNSFAVVYLLFLLFQINMVGYGFMLSAFISKSSSATTVGFSIFIVSFLAQLITSSGFPYNSDFGNTIKVLWSLFPPNLLTKGIIFLANATSNPKATPITWSDIGKCAPTEYNCYLTMLGIYKWLGFSFIAWFLLAIYLDNIFLNSAGVRKPVYYFLNPGYWTGRGGNKVKEARLCSCCCTKAITPFDPITPDDQDVLEEENLVKKQAIEDIVDPNTAVQIRGLVKIYPGKTKVGCCKCKTSPGFQAVKGTWLNFQKDQLFCLLGPNGAGKTTTISCLTGTAPVTAGEALIYGHSIRSSVGMANIRKIIGVCPQFDILWEALSGTEHLHLFASIKGLHPSTIKEVAEKSLAEVRLTEASQRRAGSYSGGMKRRLSVAIALIGDPKLVILDEPTTGMDPVTRRHVWDIIENAKKGRAIILTTHSMEEADILSDRIGIMAKGRLRCIGTSIRLKSRFGAGFIANVSFSGVDGVNSKSHGAVKRFFKDHLNVMPTEENKSFLTYVIPHDREKQLTNFFAELQDRQNEFGVSDIQLGLTTLEEVFMNIARQAELETAQAEGTMAILTLTSGHELQIPLGARFIGIPGTGHMVEVYWEQDDTGGLCISGHSPEAAIPPHVHVQAPPFAGKGEAGPPLGLVIDPSQVGVCISIY